MRTVPASATAAASDLRLHTAAAVTKQVDSTTAVTTTVLDTTPIESAMSICKQNYASESEAGFNRQINAELQAAHTYLSISAYFGRDTVALPGLRKYFEKQSKEEREHADKFIEYQNQRGGRVQLTAISAPETEWKSARNCVEVAIQMEKDINLKLLELTKLTEEQGDPQAADFITSTFLAEQVESLKELADMLTNLNRLGNDGVGLWLFDQELERKL